MPVFRRIRRSVTLQLMALVLICCTCFAAALLFEAIWPDASGNIVYSENGFTIDASHAEEGYFMAKRDECSSSLKMRVTKDGSVYTYDLNNTGAYESFPLQMGSGTYVCTLYRHVQGNKYATEAEIKFTAELDSEYSPYLSPSQYVYYTEEFDAVEVSEELCEELETEEEKYQAIVGYISENFAYDYERAASNPGFYLGDVEVCYEDRIGLCQDLSAVAACMLRTQGIPTQLVIGYADRYYHAWNNVLIDGEYRRLDITAEVTGVPASVYTEERHY